MTTSVFRNFLPTLFVFSLLLGCDDSKKPVETQTEDLLSSRSSLLLYPANQIVTFGDSVRFEIQPTDSSISFDSAQVLVDEQQVDFALIRESGNNRIPVIISGKDLKIGTHTLVFKARLKGKDWEQSSQTFSICSDKKPEILGYQMVQSFPHAITSFTQGLEWFGSKLYEGTGLNGKSKLMEVDLKTGTSLQKISLEQVYFGEGITVMNNELYQITWQNRKGFVYELPTLKQTRTFSYPTDGWGLTHWDNKLVMTDGSNKLYFLDPISFKPLGSVQVWDDKNAVDQLNELETVRDVIYANKYTTDTIVKIDPSTGKVLAYIDLKSLLPEADKEGEEDVLNGIAYRPDEKLFYLTGKNWPKMYSVRFVSKKIL